MVISLSSVCIVILDFCTLMLFQRSLGIHQFFHSHSTFEILKTFNRVLIKFFIHFSYWMISTWS